MQDKYMDKQQLAQEILAKYGKTGYVPQNKQPVDLNSRFAELDAIASGQSLQTGEKKRTFMEKIADFTGGKELSQGIAQAINLPEAKKQLDNSIETQTKIQTDLINKKRELLSKGEDTSNIDNLLKESIVNMDKIRQGADALLNPNNLTNKQIIGDALQLATTIVSAGSLKGATQGVLPETEGVIKGITKGETVGKGILQGAKTGAITGGAFGASTGASQALQEDKSMGDIAKETALGGIGGAVTGGILGGVTGGVSGAINGKQATKIAKEEKNVLDAITPNTKNISSKEYTKLLEKGKITPKTKTQGSQYILSDSEKQTALKYKDLLKTKDPVKNFTAITDEISKQDDNVGNFLRQNNGIFNNGELKNSLKNSLSDITDISIDEKVINKNKQKLIDNFIKGLDKNDMESLWKARKEFDKQIEKSFTGSPTLQSKIKREFRNAIQDFIADRTPDDVYKTSMKEMRNLFELRDLVNRKAVSEKGQSAIQLWLKNNPTKAKIIGLTAGSGLIGSVGFSMLKD